MNFDNIPIWFKSLVAAFLGGFAGALYDVLVMQQQQGSTDYKRAAAAGLFGGVLALAAYLKPAPTQVVKMLLIGGLLSSALATSACGNERNLAKIGYDINLGINSTTHVVVDLHNEGVIYASNPQGYRQFLALISTIQKGTDDLNKELDKLATLDSTNKQEVLRYIDLLGVQLLQARRIAGKDLPPKVVNAIAIGQAALNGARIVVAAYQGAPKPMSKIKYKPVEVSN